MTTPISTQPSTESSQQNNDISLDTDQYSVAPVRPPVILGPIEPSAPELRTFGPHPTLVTCHMCKQQVTTIILHRTMAKTHLLACCLCVIGCWPCSCVPYCMHSCKKTDHYCPYCSAFMGSYVMSDFL